MTALDTRALERTVTEIANRWPSAGLAVGVVHGGRLDWFLGHGLADIETKTPVTADTVFRIASVTKTFTAIAVMQLWEQGLVDLDAPVDEYLRTFELVPANGVAVPTLRHLLTHTGGIGYWRRLSDVLRPGVGSGDVGHAPVPSPAQYYRDGLPVEVEPGTKWVYSNHGMATAGQVVEDVTGEPIAAYLRDHVFEPLAMDDTAVGHGDETQSPATGYSLHANGLRPVKPYDVPLAAAGGATSTTADLARYVIALLNGGIGERGPVLKPETLATMFEPHHQSDPRVPGFGLGFMLGSEDGHRTVGHDGILSGFLSAISLAPDDGLGVVVLSNTGRLDGRGAAAPLAVALQRRLLELPNDPVRHDVAQHPEVWGELVGWYGLDPGPVTNLFTRLLMGAGAEVRIRRDHLVLQPLSPLPQMAHGLRLYPDDADDPYVFRVDFSPMGQPTLRVAFNADPGGNRPLRLVMDGMSFEKRPDSRNPRLWARGVTAGAATVFVIRRLRRRAGSQ